MKINSLHISNILSFQYHADISNAEAIEFKDGLNIIIGENGAGKSTALEVINFLFKRVITKQFPLELTSYRQRTQLNLDDRKRIIPIRNETSYQGFRLEPNWNTEGNQQSIRLKVTLDDIDRVNLQNIERHIDKLNALIDSYTTRPPITPSAYQGSYTIDVTLNKTGYIFTTTLVGSNSDFGYLYLTEYNLFRELILIHNQENPQDLIPPLFEPFSLIGSYRNYHKFTSAVTLRDELPALQVQNYKKQENSRSLNSSDNQEPSIFSIVRLRVAEKHYSLWAERLSETERQDKANDLEFLKSINERLKVIQLSCKIKLTDQQSWNYSFEFFDLRHQRVVNDINSLSAGQKAILHLIFESYGQGELKGGLVIIDEPEIHLHYQFQHEYLHVINDLNRTQKSQYILVTHSEALINSSTISHVQRFYLDQNGYTKIKAPLLSTNQKNLIKILDNTRSIFAFFAKKVLLVEGDGDRFFYRAVIQELYPHLNQEIAVIGMGSKNSYPEWSALFKEFGLSVYFIADFDYIIKEYPSEKGVKLTEASAIASFKARHTDWETKIDTDHANQVFTLKKGALENYINVPHNVIDVMNFSVTTLPTFLMDAVNPHSIEIKDIFRAITS